MMTWKHFPRYLPFLRGIHQSPVNSPDKCQWRGVLMFSLICVSINGWVNKREAGDLRRYRIHYDVIVMAWTNRPLWCTAGTQCHMYGCTEGVMHNAQSGPFKFHSHSSGTDSNYLDIICFNIYHHLLYFYGNPCTLTGCHYNDAVPCIPWL